MELEWVSDQEVIAGFSAALLSSTRLRIFCIGIGGIGVSGLAVWLHELGHEVSGCDLRVNEQTTSLQALGMSIEIGDDIGLPAKLDWIIYTAAISSEHALFRQAVLLGLPVISRGQALAAMLADQTSIVVAGSHGKTTTASLIAYAACSAKPAVSYYLGGLMCGQTRSVSVTPGLPFVVESDESDGSFSYLAPRCVVVTNIDHDHLSAYGDSYSCLKDRFIEFIASVPRDGLAIVCGDDPGVLSILPMLSFREVPVVTYGFSDGVDVRITDLQRKSGVLQVVCETADGQSLQFPLSLPGVHNVLNALGAWLALAWLNADQVSTWASSWAEFPGVARRFMRYELNFPVGLIPVVEDYGHHPRALAVTIATARELWPDSRLVMVFQPHRYTRTRDLLLDFVAVLAEVDVLLLMDVYAAGELPVAGGERADLLRPLVDAGVLVETVSMNDVVVNLAQRVKANDLLLLQGAGDVANLVNALQRADWCQLVE